MLDKEAYSIQTQWEECKERTRRHREKIAPLSERLRVLSADAETLRTQLVKMDETEAPSDVLEDHQASLRQSEAALEVAFEAHQQASARCQEKTHARAALLQEFSFHKEHAKQLEEETKSRLRSEKEWGQQAALIKKEQARMQDDLYAAHEEKKQAEERLQKLEEAHFSASNELGAQEKKLEALRKKEDSFQFSVVQMKSDSENNAVEKNSLMERIKVSFGKDEQELSACLTEKNEATLEQSIVRAEQKMKAMSEVNTASIDNYERIKKRHDFIASERDDLMKARASLDATIAKIDGTLRRQFLDAFQSIRAHFQDIFRTIFSPDDSCDIILSDPKLPLSSSVDVVACPKGKKPLGIHQLSGGEKTLTALALLFAAYRYRPSPFCVLDEVDAPLDDVNTEKFNRMVKAFSEHSQFILITHNKLTMQAADALYGVTMAEEGVSSVFSGELGGAFRMKATLSPQSFLLFDDPLRVGASVFKGEGKQISASREVGNRHAAPRIQAI